MRPWHTDGFVEEQELKTRIQRGHGTNHDIAVRLWIVACGDKALCRKKGRKGWDGRKRIFETESKVALTIFMGKLLNQATLFGPHRRERMLALKQS